MMIAQLKLPTHVAHRAVRDGGPTRPIMVQRTRCSTCNTYEGD